MSIDDIRRLPDEAFAKRKCGSTCVAPDDAELTCDKELGHAGQLCQQTRLLVGQRGFQYMWLDNDRRMRPADIDRDALRDCISDVCVSETGYAELEMSKAIAKAILESFDVRLKP